jgi:hypothetical protein
MNNPDDFSNIHGLQFLLEELTNIFKTHQQNPPQGFLEAAPIIENFISNHPENFAQEGSKDRFRTYLLSECSKQLARNSNAESNVLPQPPNQPTNQLGPNVQPQEQAARNTMGGPNILPGGHITQPVNHNFQAPTNLPTHGNTNVPLGNLPYPNHPMGYFPGYQNPWATAPHPMNPMMIWGGNMAPIHNQAMATQPPFGSIVPNQYSQNVTGGMPPVIARTMQPPPMQQPTLPTNPHNHFPGFPPPQFQFPPAQQVDAVSLSTASIKKPEKQGLRYQTVAGFNLEARSMDDAANVFTSCYGCKNTNLPAVLNKESKLLRNTKTKEPMQIFHCSCLIENLMVTPKVQLVDTNENMPLRNFKVEIPKSHFAYIDQHFFKLVQVESLPNFVQNKILYIFQGDPTATVMEVLHDLHASNEPSMDGTPSISQWIVNETFVNGKNVFPDIVQFITEQRAIAIQNMELHINNDRPEFQNIHGASVQGAIQYSHQFSFTNFIRAGMDAPTFHTFQQFMEFYEFGKSDKVITIPIIGEMFEGTAYSTEQIDRSTSCILFTSPRHIWALHQLLSSETHRYLDVYSMDGTFSLRMSRSGSDKTVILSLGFIHLDVHSRKANGSITRSFVPIIHCLAPSENSPAAFICLSGLSSIYRSFFSMELSIEQLCADNSAAICSGLRQAFPNANMITDVEHVRSGPLKKWSEKILGGNKMQKLIVYWLNLLFHTRSHINYCNAFGVLTEHLRALGELNFSEFLEERYGPNAPFAWNMRYNSSDRVGIIAEQQQIEAYYGMVKPNTKLGRSGALNTNAGYAYLLREGFASLLSWDVMRMSRYSIGYNSPRMLDAMKELTPEHMILALTMDASTDTFSTVSPNENVNQYCVVEGFLCNGPTYIGKKITSQYLIYYVSANTHLRPPNSWPHGFKKYINLTNRFCLVRPIHEYANISMEHQKQVQHLLFLPPGSYFCTCHLFWQRLDCPASIFINNCKGKLHASLDARIDLVYAGRDVSLATPNRRRGVRVPSQGQMAILFEALGLPHTYANAKILKYMHANQKSTLDRAARLRSTPSKKLATKTESILHIIAGTALGNDVLVAGTLTRQELYSSWRRMQNNTYVSDSTFLDQNSQFNAIFNPFPEGIDPIDPNCCVAYWILIPNVNTLLLNNVHLISFYYACQHVSEPGFGGRVTEHVLTSLERITLFSIFLNGLNPGMNLQLSDFLLHFHRKYLLGATVTNYFVNGNIRNSRNENCDIVKTHIRAMLELMSFHDNNEHIPRMACAVVMGTFSISILRKTHFEGQADELETRIPIHTYIRGPKKGKPYYLVRWRDVFNVFLYF